ncbi:hypothetical protein D9M72_498810 [compost metagenome]
MAQGEHRDVGLHAGRQPPEVFPAKSSRTAEGRGVKVVGQGPGVGPPLNHPGQVHAHVHAPHQVRRERVGTQAHIDSGLAETVKRIELLLVAERGQRAVDNADAVPGQHVQRTSGSRRCRVLAANHHPVRNEKAGAEQAGGFEQFQDAASG